MKYGNLVYIIGAGFNQCVNNKCGLKPPLSTNFFNTILSSENFNNPLYCRKAKLVYDYIYKYWKKSIDDLKNTEFNIEECFTLIQLQLIKASKLNNKDDILKLKSINSLLKFMFIEALREFQPFSNSSDAILKFGKLIYKQRPEIITFNYDCNLETAIESASDDYNFNCALSYGIKFDSVIDLKINNCNSLKSNDFYSKNKQYDWNILKLHGSLNWFKYTDNNDNLKILLSLNNADIKDYINSLSLVEPLIIPPVPYKKYDQKYISTLWDEAKIALSNCKSLIVIGYSFPITDFGVKKLLLEAFEKNELEKLIIVNPDTSVINTVKKLTHFKKPVLVCDNLDEFLQNVDHI
ncbi:MAG: SIR2 family protein [Clostridium sp.]|nr:SIR2 family protein [Clostridium sp.]